MTSDPAAGAEDLRGTVLAERYRIDELLGAGGMGSVYLARHLTLDKEVALKVLHGQFSRKADLVERFLQEARAASRIRNPHVIDITDFGVSDEGHVFFAMERLRGRDLHAVLAEALQNGGLPWSRARSILTQVCSALAAAHEQGIVHRDLKPENIYLVDFDGQEDYVKLLDFGIAKVLGVDDGERRLTRTGMVFGTPEYMAPEQAKGEVPDHRVDIYAMGCLLYQCLAGRVPFQAESFMGVLTLHMTKDPEPIPEVDLARLGAPLGLLRVVERALAKDREARYGTAAELAAAMQSPPTTERPKPLSRPFPMDLPLDPGWTGALRNPEDFDSVEDELTLPRRSHAAWMVLAAVVVAGAVAAFLLMRRQGTTAEAEPATEVTPALPTPAMQPAAEGPEPATQRAADGESAQTRTGAERQRAQFLPVEEPSRPRENWRESTAPTVTEQERVGDSVDHDAGVDIVRPSELTADAAPTPAIEPAPTADEQESPPPPGELDLEEPVIQRPDEL